MKQAILLVLFLAVSSAYAAPTDSSEECTSERADKCTKDAMAFAYRPGKPVPSTIDEIMEVCDVVKNGSKCVRKYVKECAPTSVKELAKIYTSRFTKVYSKFCTNDGPQTVLKHRQCAADTQAALRHCYRQTQKDLYTVLAADKKMWQKLSCCYASRAVDCGQTAIRKNCNSESAKFMEEEGLALATEASETFCPEDLQWGTKVCAEMTINLQEPKLPETPSILSTGLEIMTEIAVSEDDS